LVNEFFKTGYFKNKEYKNAFRKRKCVKNLQTTRREKMKHSIIFLILVIIALGLNLCGIYMHDYSCIAFSNQCDENGIKESTPILGQLIPGAAVSFLESTRDFEDFLKEVEKSELYGPNYPVLQAGIEKAIVGMDNARCKYEEIVNISESLEMDMVILEKLNQFDYDGLQSKYNLNPSIFEKAAAFCQGGDVIGIYNHTFDAIDTILENLNRIKAKLEQESLPELYIIWETGQLYFESEMFGQYVSRIFYEITRAMRRTG
jgi:hypothetical protein